MILWMIAAGLLLGLPVLGLFPRVAEGRAWNGAFAIRMPSGASGTYGAAWRSVLAQEFAEWWAAWAGAVLISAPFAFALALLPFGWAFAPALLLPAWKWRTTDWGERQLEYIGWAAEWAHGRRHVPELYPDFDEYAARMRGGYLVFAGMTDAEAAAALRRRLWLGRALTRLLARSIASSNPA